MEMSAILGETEESKFSFFLPFSSRPVQWVTKQVSSRGSVGSCQVGRFYSNVRGMVPRGRRYRAPGTEVDTRINRKSLEQRRVAATRPASDDISNASFSKFQNAPPPPRTWRCWSSPASMLETTWVKSLRLITRRIRRIGDIRSMIRISGVTAAARLWDAWIFQYTDGNS